MKSTLLIGVLPDWIQMSRVSLALGSCLCVSLWPCMKHVFIAL